MATIKSVIGFRSEVDAESLQDALQALEDDYPKGVSALICLGTARSAYQRNSIINSHQKTYHTFAPDEIRRRIKGYTGEGIWALYMPAAKRDATWLHEAMEGLGSDEVKLAEILCTRTSSQLKAICDAYKQTYNKDLADDIAGETWRYLRELLVKLLTVTRDTGLPNREKANDLAQELFDAGEGMWGTDESKFIDIMTRESVSQLREVFDAYSAKFNHSLFDAIKGEFSGQVCEALVALARGILDPSRYFADRIWEAVEGFGTDEGVLIRCIVGRADIDLEKIKADFASKHKQELAERVGKEIGGDFLELLKAVIK